MNTTTYERARRVVRNWRNETSAEKLSNYALTVLGLNGEPKELAVCIEQLLPQEPQLCKALVLATWASRVGSIDGASYVDAVFRKLEREDSQRFLVDVVSLQFSAMLPGYKPEGKQIVRELRKLETQAFPRDKSILIAELILLLSERSYRFE